MDNDNSEIHIMRESSDDNVSTNNTRQRRERGDDNGKKKYAISVRWENEEAEKTKMSCHGSVEDCHSLCCCCARRVGGMHFICERADGSPRIMAGPCWPFCTFVTLPLILGLSGLVAYFVILKDDGGMPKWFAYIYLPLVAITLISLFGVSCQDPGLLVRVTDEEAGQGGWLWNEQVGSFRPQDALYCRECKAVIQDFDHLCPWTGTGIGKGNMFAFKAFVLFVNILCYTSLGVTAYVLLKTI